MPFSLRRGAVSVAVGSGGVLYRERTWRAAEEPEERKGAEEAQAEKAAEKAQAELEGPRVLREHELYLALVSPAFFPVTGQVDSVADTTTKVKTRAMEQLSEHHGTCLSNNCAWPICQISAIMPPRGAQKVKHLHSRQTDTARRANGCSRCIRAIAPMSADRMDTNVALVVVLLLLLLPVSPLTQACTLSQLPLLQQRALRIEATMAMSAMQKLTHLRTQRLEMRLAVMEPRPPAFPAPSQAALPPAEYLLDPRNTHHG